MLQTAGVLVTFTREGRGGRRVIRLQTGPTGAVSPNGDRHEDQLEPAADSPPPSPPEAVSAPLVAADGSGSADADNPFADSPHEAPPAQAAVPPVAAVFDRAAYRARITDLFRRSNLYGVGVRDDPPAAAALTERFLDLTATAVTEAARPR